MSTTAEHIVQAPQRRAERYASRFSGPREETPEGVVRRGHGAAAEAGRIQSRRFITLSEGRTQSPDDHRHHMGLLVDDKDAIRRALGEAGVEILPGRGLDFLDPWGNRWQVVEYAEVQFTKASEVLKGMGLEGLNKTEKALDGLRKKGLAWGAVIFCLPGFEKGWLIDGMNYWSPTLGEELARHSMDLIFQEEWQEAGAPSLA
ncbi:MAG: hypothetical protein M3122_07310 [Actinomycetota bacterium]|nr:hypothetical protein [Actinomycetota bacterium]